MRRKQLAAIARSLCEHFCSRNHDIAGYWGIGRLCQLGRKRITYRIRPGLPIVIHGCEVSESAERTGHLVKCGVDSIEAQFSFRQDGLYPDGTAKWRCGVAVAVLCQGRMGLHHDQVVCWAHDPRRELRSARKG